MISLSLKRPVGQGAVLIIDARPFHEYLKSLGCTERDGQIENAPHVYRGRMIDPDEDRLTTAALLKTGGPHTIDLSTQYGSPPNMDRIMKLLDTDALHDTARRIVDHYRPIEIQVSIVAKPLRPISTPSQSSQDIGGEL